MAEILEYRIVYTGLAGLPGYNVLHSDEGTPAVSTPAQAFADLLRTAYLSIAPYIGAGVTMNIDPEVRIIDPATGGLVDVAAVSWSAPIPASGGSPLPFNTCVRCDHATGAVVDGKRINGHTYFSPVTNIAFNSGVVAPSAVTAFTAMWNGLQDVVGPRLVIWRRPRKPSATLPAREGAFARVNTSSVRLIPGTQRRRTV